VSESKAYSNTIRSIPWWRVLKDGKPSCHMPGGVDEQILRLKTEGVELKHQRTTQLPR
jgi:alkylated DNA nucleotide flippase Atl1